MEFKGTKGKWEVKHSKMNTAFNVVGTVLGGKYKVARCPYIIDGTLPNEINDREIDEAQANAKLIASAPALLEMLISIQGKLNGYVPEILHDEIELLIKKATE